MIRKLLQLGLCATLVLTGCGGAGNTDTEQAPARQAQRLAPQAAAVSAGTTVYFSGNRSNYSIAQSGSGFTVTDSTGSDGVTAVASNVTLLKFADSYIALGTDGNPAQAYRIYQAAFDRTPDASGLGFWIVSMDAGTSLRTVASGFLQSAEFTTRYGSNPTATQFVTGLYNNVLHRTPDNDGLNYWVGAINGGEPRANVLAFFSESAENKTQVSSAIQNGIAYAPYFLAPSASAQLAAGGTSFSTAVKSDGTLWGFGANLYGAVGDGSYSNRKFPALIGSG